MITINLLLAIAVMVAYQALNGYTQFDLPLYFKMLFVEHGPYFYLTAVLALFTQVITRQKYAAMALTVLISLSKIPLDALGWYHNLYRWASTNDIEYSPMNGYGHLMTGHLWYVLYWGLCGTALMLTAYIFWPRGIVSGGLARLAKGVATGWGRSHALTGRDARALRGSRELDFLQHHPAQRLSASRQGTHRR
ncbi:MAG: hypothetical protein HC857_14640 [Synechococcales cyanobacterium RU_4_20]|nr:hypothetical protein [Synechococcales cyanobacterium RU_4_20]